MGLWRPPTELLLILAITQTGPLRAAQSVSVDAAPALGSPDIGKVGNLSPGSSGPLGHGLTTMSPLSPTLSPASAAPLVQPTLAVAQPGLAGQAAPIPVLPPSAWASPAEASAAPGLAEGRSGAAPIPGGNAERPGASAGGSGLGSEQTRPPGAGPEDSERARGESGLLFDGAGAPRGSAAVPELPSGAAPQAGAPAGVLLRRLVDEAIQDGRVPGRLGQEIKQAAYVDPLTGAFNRLYLDEEGDRVIGKHKTIITFKLDWLKEINDGAGHAAGDQFLAETARIVHRVLGPDGLLVRRSPTGFAVFTDRTGPQAELLAETLRAAVAARMAGRTSRAYDVKTQAPLHSTIQLGMAPIAGDYAAILGASERSREAAKAAGGDQVADAQGRPLPRQSVAGLRRALRAGGQGELAGRLEAELSRRPQDATAAPRRSGRRMNDILHDVSDLTLRHAVSDFLFRNRLSGLRNRRWLDENVPELMAAGRITRYAALDLDKFSDVNRILGEVKADRVLARFGRILAEFAAGHDIEIVTGRDLEAITARDLEALHLSGEEFCLLIGPGEKDVRGLLDKLRERVQDELGPRASREDGIAGPDGKPLRITVSIGEARIGEAEGDPLALVLEAGERAERSLIKAKGSGRNRVVLEDD